MLHLQAKSHILSHGHVLKKGIILEDGVHRSQVRWLASHHLVFDTDLPFRRPLKTRDHAQRSGFSTTRRTQQREEFTILDLKRNVIHGNHLTPARIWEPLNHIPHLNRKLCLQNHAHSLQSSFQYLNNFVDLGQYIRQAV